MFYCQLSSELIVHLLFPYIPYLLRLGIQLIKKRLNIQPKAERSANYGTHISQMCSLYVSSNDVHLLQINTHTRCCRTNRTTKYPTM